MKKILFLGLMLVSLLTACQKEDELDPSERPDARLNQTLTDYKNQLTGPEFGWKAVLYPNGGAGYSFLIKFMPNDRVSMTSDINASTAETTLESTYRLKALQRPALIFDTYNYMHILADPDETKSSGVRGAGKFSDFEFSFESVTPETITLTGNLQGSRMVLTKATREDAENFIKQTAATAQQFANLQNLRTYFKRVTLGATAFDILIDSNFREIMFTYFEGNTLKTFITTYYYTDNGIMLLEPFTVNGVTITSLNNIQYTAATRRFTLTINNTAATIQEATRPLGVDLTFARSFFNDPGDDYWVAETGFTVDGVADALNVNSIPNYYFIALWPKYGTSGGRTYDLLGFVTVNAAGTGLELNFGPAAVSSLTSDGRIVYTYLGILGTVPAAQEAVVTATRQTWTDTQGFYIIPTGPSSVDLVSARDARSWISLYR